MLPDSLKFLLCIPKDTTQKLLLFYQKMFVEIFRGCPAVNYYLKVLHLGCCSSPRSPSDFTSKFKTDEIEQICGNRERNWIGILNRSLTEEIFIKKNQTICFFFVLETKDKINIKHETAQKTKETSSKVSIKNTKR